MNEIEKDASTENGSNSESHNDSNAGNDISESSPKPETPVGIGNDWKMKYGFYSKLEALFKDERYQPPKKPRIPNESDRNCEWNKTMIPSKMDEFLGIEEIQEPLQACLNHQVSSDVSRPNIILSGPRSTGKTSMASIFIRELMNDKSVTDVNGDLEDIDVTKMREVLFVDVQLSSGVSDLILQIKTFIQSLTKLWGKKKNASDSTKHPFKTKSYYVVIDNFQLLDGKQQHALFPIISGSNKPSKSFPFRICFMLLFTTKENYNSTNSQEIMARIREISMRVSFPKSSKSQIVEKLLQIATQETVGFENAGIIRIYDDFQQTMGSCIKLMQQVFVAHHFISFENVGKLSKDGNQTVDEKQYLTILDVASPLKRCQVCTLYPPCQHVTFEKLFKRIERSRVACATFSKKHGTDKTRSCVCPSFKRYGVCRVFQRSGKCFYDHPLTIHEIDESKAQPKCEQHTLPISTCNHCASIREMQNMVTEWEKSNRLLEAKHRKCTVERGELEDKLRMLHKKRIDDEEMAGKVLWGSAKESFEDQVRDMKDSINALGHEAEEYLGQIEQLKSLIDQAKNDIREGKTKGLGKGNGRLLIVSEQTVKVE